MCSQPCEEFFRRIRCVSTVNSSVVNCSTKEMLNRISRIQLLGEIGNDPGFVYAKSVKSTTQYSEDDFPNECEIISIIQNCKAKAIETAEKIGLISEKKMADESIFFCQVLPKNSSDKKSDNIQSRNNSTFTLENNIKRFGELKTKLIYSSLKNFAGKFEENTIPETSSYLEFFSNDRRFVFKKSSVCWLLRNYSYKSSSDRRYRVMNPIKNNKKVKTHTKYKRYVPKKKIAKRQK